MKNLIRYTTGIAILFAFSNCSVYKASVDPGQKFGPNQLEEDYEIFRGILEESHPGLYWYTSKEEMDQHFDWGAEKIKDSLTEEQFRKVLNYVVARINCGHTVVRSSRNFIRARDSLRLRVFPLNLKLWPDTAVIATNLHRNDSLLKRGTVVTKIEGIPVENILDTLFRFVSSDGYNLTHKYQSLSNRNGFGSAYTSIFGLKENYHVDYVDSLGDSRTAILKFYDPRTDTAFVEASRNFGTSSRKVRKSRIVESSRSLRYDSTGTIAIMELNSFGRSLGLKRFLRRSFRSLDDRNTANLIIDLRANGGGSVSNSTLLTKFIADRKFKVADSLYSNTRKSKYSKYINAFFFNRLFMMLTTKKQEDGKYHFGYFERHYFKPKKNNHFNQNVYILTGGNSFSATTLFSQTVRDQDNVIVVGEETGGAAYGNSAWLIPDAVLPNTRVRFRLPLFRLVISKEITKDGRGVQPEIFSGPSVEAIRKGEDYKMQRVIQIIRQGQQY